MAFDLSKIRALTFALNPIKNALIDMASFSNTVEAAKAVSNQLVYETLTGTRAASTTIQFAASGTDSDWYADWKVPAGTQLSGSTATVHVYAVGDADPAADRVFDMTLDYQQAGTGEALPAATTATRTADPTYGLEIKTADWQQVRYLTYALTGLSAGKLILLRWRRLGSTGTDTYTQTMSGLHIGVSYTRALVTA